MKLALRFLLVLALFGGGLAAVHLNLPGILSFDLPFSIGLLVEAHLLIFVLTFLVLLAMVAINKHFADKLGFAFLGSVLFKMLLVASYFIIRMKALPNPPDKQFVLHFFAIYFIYLALETVLVYNNMLKNK